MPTKPLADNQLIRAFKRGSIDAFEELIVRYETKIYNLAMRFMRSQEDAEEVLQDVFSTLYRKMASFEGKSAFSSWLYRITVNAAFMKLRKRKQSHTVSIEDLAPAVKQQCLDHDIHHNALSDYGHSTRELREILNHAIGRLPEQYRAVFVLRDVDGLSNEEVSHILQLSVPAVKSRLHRSRLMLRRRLVRYYKEFVGRQPPLEEEELEEASNG